MKFYHDRKKCRTAADKRRHCRPERCAGPLKQRDRQKDELARKEKRYGAELKDSEARLELLKASSRKIIDNINTVMTRLDKVLENDGTSNDNN